MRLIDWIEREKNQYKASDTWLQTSVFIFVCFSERFTVFGSCVFICLFVCAGLSVFPHALRQIPM